MREGTTESSLYWGLMGEQHDSEMGRYGEHWRQVESGNEMATRQWRETVG
jgi:hypothetical protein